MKKIGFIILVVMGFWACKGSNASTNSSDLESLPTQSNVKTQEVQTTETQTTEKQAQPLQKTNNATRVVTIDPNNPPQIPVSKTPKGSQ